MESQEKIINLARQRARTVQVTDKATQQEHRLYQKWQRKVDEERMRIKKARLEKKREELSRLTKVKSSSQLNEALEQVEGRTQKQREAAKIDVLKKQLQMRNPDKRVVLSERKNL